MYAHMSSSMGYRRSKGSCSFNEFYYLNDIRECSPSWASPFITYGFSVNPRILYGLRQSTLLQYSACRRLIWGGNCGNGCLRSVARERVCDCSRGNRVSRPLEERREKRERRMSCVDWERSSSSGSVDEVLSLLTDAISKESVRVGGRNSSSAEDSVRKMRVRRHDDCDVEKEVTVDECSQREVKNAGHDTYKRSIKGEVVVKFGEAYRQSTIDESVRKMRVRRHDDCDVKKEVTVDECSQTEVKNAGRDTYKRSLKGEVVIKSGEAYRQGRKKDSSMNDEYKARKIDCGSRKEEHYIESDSRERMSKGGVVIKSAMEGYRNPRKEKFLGDDVHEARKDTSSSSYYSIASSGDLESNVEDLQSNPERVVEESSSVHRNSQRWEREDASVEEVKRHKKYESNMQYGESSTKRCSEIQSAMQEGRVESDVQDDDFVCDLVKSSEKHTEVLGSQESSIQRASRSENRLKMRKEGIETSSSNLFHGGMVQNVEKDQQVVGQREMRKEHRKLNTTSEIHEDNSSRVSSSQNILNSRIIKHREENIASKLNVGEETRRQRGHIDYQVREQDKPRKRSNDRIEVLEVHDPDIDLTISPQVEDNSTLVLNSVQQAREQYTQNDQQVYMAIESIKEPQNLTDVSEIHVTDTKRASNFQRVSRTRINEQEGSSTNVLNRTQEAKERHLQINELVIGQHGSRKESQKRMTRPEFRGNDVERAQSSSQTLVNTGIKEPAERSVFGSDSVQEPGQQQSGVLDAEYRKLVMVTPPQTQLVVRDSPTYAAQADENVDGGFSASYTFQQGSTQSTLQELDGRIQRDEMHGRHSESLIDGGALESANRFDNSSAQIVGDFVDMLQQEVSTSQKLSVASTHISEFPKESTSSPMASITQDEKYKQQSPRRFSTGSRVRGPPAEMWDVAGPSSSLESSGTEAPKNNSLVAGAMEPTVQTNAGNVIARRSSRSLWSYIADMLRKGWGSRAESHTPTVKSVARSSSNESLNSEYWFSGDEPDNDNDGNTKKSKRGTLTEPLQTNQTQPVSEVIRSKEKLTRAESGASVSMDLLERGSTFEGASSVSLKSDFDQVEEEKARQGVPSRVVSIDSAFPLAGALTSSSRHRITSDRRETSESEKAQMSISDTTDLDEELIKEGVTEATSTEEKDAQVKRRKLQRNKQVMREHFDEWEEAFKNEHEQRRNDEMFMREALSEAKKAADSWEVPVGAVLVQNGKIIARGFNLVEELRDSTAHAEMICIREASNLLRTWRLAGLESAFKVLPFNYKETTLYVTLEPCPMCAGAILQARIDVVVWGAPNKLLGADGSWVSLFPGEDERKNGSDHPPGPVHPFHPNIAIRRGILAAECSDVMQQFFQLRRKKNKKPAPSPHLPISNHPRKFLSKLHHVFNFMFCL